ncbi:MAG: YecA family protein [Pseudonocardiaceae bacterium]
MDPAKVALLFGHAPSWADPDDPEDRAKLLAELPDRHGEDWLGRSMVLEVVASHIADDDPPQVWRAAERLLADGMDRADVLWQLVLALSRPLLTALAEETELDRHAYVAALARLPVPSGEDIANAVIGTVVSHQPLAVDDLDRLVSEQLGTQDGDPLIGMMIDNLMDGDGPIAILAGDLLVHVESFTAGIVLTHRLSEAEQDTDILATGVDLSGFNHRWQLRLPGGEEVERVEGDAPGWVGPPGWLREFPAGALLAVRIDDGTVRLAAVDQQPVNSGELVDLLRAAYDAEVEEPWLPVDAEELVLGMLVRQPRAFAEPAAPLTELAMAAGLEGRGKSFAHEESVWESDRSARRDWRVLHRMGPWSNAATAIRVLNLLDDDVLDAAAAREVLAGLYEPDVLDVVPDELLGVHDDPELLARTGALADRLLAVASRPREQAAAHWLAALVAERRREVREAESHVRMAVHADPGWGPALDRLAWYESDRGDAAAALTRWRQCGLTAEDSDDVRTVAPFAADPGPKLGRNQPCWCGSGRKFKVCHLGRPALASLPDRVGWLCRKATGYLERRGGAAALVTIEHVTARAVDPEDPESLQEACRDPLVIDVVLHEDGWFEEFLSDRGALLPEDEVMLARTWTLVARTVYEVLEVSTGRGLTLRDLRTGDRIEVRERSFSRQARPGTLVCGRAVPDGESHQFVGGLFGVAPGSERELLDLLDEGDGMALLEYVAELHRPPQLVSADGVALR